MLLLFFTVATDITDIISARGYCDMIIFILKKDGKIASGLPFGCSTYAHKVNEITFPIQLVSCKNSSGINRNHKNSMFIVATGMMISSCL
jgi:hypothetical protein